MELINEQKEKTQLLKTIWEGVNPCREINQDTGQDMFWDSVVKVIEDYNKGMKPYPLIYYRIISRFGRDVQIHKIQEEALELALALNQIHCPTKNRELMEDNLYSELADMKIMMTQAEILFDKDRIDEQVEFKLNQFKEKYL